MELNQHLYVKIDSNVRGPVSANVLHKMFKNNEIDSTAMFSFDGSKWASITKLFSSKAAKSSLKSSGNNGKKNDEGLKAVNTSGLMSEVPALLKKTDKAAETLSKTFEFVTYLVFALASIGMSMMISIGVRFAIPQFSALFHIAIAVVPAILIAGVIAHSFGNFYIKVLTKLSQKEKFSLALHVPWESSSAQWPVVLKKWLYCNDWLVDNDSLDIMPYVRAFVTGSAPASVDEEVDLWRKILQGNRKGFNASVGHSVRELACLERLPVWTSEITPGMNLFELEKSLGSAGRKWAIGLLKRAATKRTDLKEIALNGTFDDVIFEFFCSRLEDGRECLLVVISSSLSNERKTRSAKHSKSERAA